MSSDVASAIYRLAEAVDRQTETIRELFNGEDGHIGCVLSDISQATWKMAGLEE